MTDPLLVVRSWRVVTTPSGEAELQPAMAILAGLGAPLLVHAEVAWADRRGTGARRR